MSEVSLEDLQGKLDTMTPASYKIHGQYSIV